MPVPALTANAALEVLPLLPRVQGLGLPDGRGVSAPLLVAQAPRVHMTRRGFFAAAAWLLTGCATAVQSVIPSPRIRTPRPGTEDEEWATRRLDIPAAYQPCPVCGLPVAWTEVRTADVTGPNDTTRIYAGLGNIYWHREGDRLTRCHRDFYALTPVKGVAYRVPARNWRWL